MPNKKSAIKHMRRDAKKAEQNTIALSELHTRQKRVTLLAKTDLETAKKQARIFISKLDKAVVHGVIPHKRADRKKARITRLLHKATA